ncbi:MAG: MBL fold metallo-hydrolase [Hyphomicrobiaceae bacterium]|nr:MBL fold metallo-hydrolase [Hyphomicrobiaceae bacterium]
MRVILLGTGGPRPDPQRMATATLIQHGDENVLFDAGRGVMVQAVKAKIPLASINPVFITHHHFDHIGDLYDVMLNTWLHGRKHTLQIYGPPDTERLVNTLLTQVYDKDITWRDKGEPTFGGWKPVAATDVTAGLVVDTGRWKVTAEIVRHGDGLDMPPAFLKRWTCLGYRFEAEGKVIAISGDTVSCDGLDRLAKGADLLVQCCFLSVSEMTNDHFRRLAEHTLACGDTVGKIATRAGVKALALTHHRPRINDAALVELEREVRRDFTGRLIIGRDLTEIIV